MVSERFSPHQLPESEQQVDEAEEHNSSAEEVNCILCVVPVGSVPLHSKPYVSIENEMCLC